MDQAISHKIIDEPAINDIEAPPEGKAWRRKSDGVIYTGPLTLGKLFFLNGKRLTTPIKEKPEDFELVDLPKE